MDEICSNTYTSVPSELIQSDVEKSKKNLEDSVAVKDKSHPPLTSSLSSVPTFSSNIVRSMQIYDVNKKNHENYVLDFENLLKSQTIDPRLPNKPSDKPRLKMSEVDIIPNEEPWDFPILKKNLNTILDGKIAVRYDAITNMIEHPRRVKPPYVKPVVVTQQDFVIKKKNRNSKKQKRLQKKSRNSMEIKVTSPDLVLHYFKF